MIFVWERGTVQIRPAFSNSRFARSTTHLLNALQIIKAKNVSFVSLTEKIDTSTPVGIAIFSILAAISQLERDLIAERVKAGLANARAAPPVLSTDTDPIGQAVASFPAQVLENCTSEIAFVSIYLAFIRATQN